MGIKEQLVNWELSKPKQLWSSEAWRHKITYKMKVGRSFSVHDDWGVPDGRELVKIGNLMPFYEDDLSSFYGDQRYLQEMT